MHPRFTPTAILALSLTTLLTTLQAQTPTLSPAVAKYVKVNAPAILLTHVRIIDGTGAAPLEDQSILIENGKITSISKETTAAPNVAVIDLHNHTIIPGLVGMHDHLYYIAPTKPPTAPPSRPSSSLR
jgi:adenine deaminase